MNFIRNYMPEAYEIFNFQLQNLEAHVVLFTSIVSCF